MSRRTAVFDETVGPIGRRGQGRSSWVSTVRGEPVLAMIGRLFGKGAGADSPADPPPKANARVAAQQAATIPCPELRRYVSVGEPVESGDVLVLDRQERGRMKLGVIAGDSAVIGVVAAEPGRINGHASVTVSGVVLCKVDAGYGPIHPGDSLTVSPTPGHAMHSRVHGPGAILGRALEPLEEGCGRIKILVTLR